MGSKKFVGSGTLVKRKAMVCPVCNEEQKNPEEEFCGRCSSKYKPGEIWEPEGGKENKKPRIVPY